MNTHTRIVGDPVRSALAQCRDQFAFYAGEHEAAGKDEKAATNRKFADLASAALATPVGANVGDVLLASVKEAMDEHSECGLWRTCSGCHETEDGHDVGHYPFVPQFGCKLGSGCRECGGLGALWDTTDWSDFAEWSQRRDRDIANIKAVLITAVLSDFLADELAGEIAELKVPNAEPDGAEKTIAILRRALAWHGDPQRMATTREEWQQEVDAAIVWVKENPEPDRPSFSSWAHRSLTAESDRAKIRSEIINTPETVDFMAGVPIEAAHQRERWGAEHDRGKSPFDWFWLIGFLAQKAASAAVDDDVEKAKHHTISTAAALANWHAALIGANRSMRPGIDGEGLA
jgi:hypothetical protein